MPAKPAVPRDLLMEMMEVQEALEEAKDAGLDEAARERLRADRGRLLDRRAATEARHRGAGRRVGCRPRPGRATARRCSRGSRSALATRAYLRTVIDDLSQALGEDQDAHVSHRRH